MRRMVHGRRYPSVISSMAGWEIHGNPIFQWRFFPDTSIFMVELVDVLAMLRVSNQKYALKFTQIPIALEFESFEALGCLGFEAV